MLTLRTADELVSAVPYLLGYHPHHDQVVVALRDHRVELTLCTPHPADPSVAADLCRRHGMTSALILGYGREGPETGRLADQLRRSGVPVLEELRVHDGHYWPAADPHRRRPLPTSSVAAASATFHGLRALPSRAALAAEQAPVTGPEREAMTVATRRAEARMAALERKPSEARLRRAAMTSLRVAARCHRAGGRLDDLPAAWLTVLLARPTVFGFAWHGPGDGLQGLWTDLVRRADEKYVAAPACLLAFAAWRGGQGSVARIAVDRALAADPDHRMAGKLDEMLYGVKPPR
jgi:uncharacterized protein DUF4192